MTNANGLIDYQGDDRVVSWTDYISIKSRDSSRAAMLSTGFAELDVFLDGGMQTGELVTISGATGQGKTLFTKTLVRNFILQAIPTTFFSFEVSTGQLLKDFETANVKSDSPLFVPLSLKPGFVDWISNRSLESKLKFENQVIVIDHLHYVVDMNVNKNFSINIGAAMRSLKEFAIRTGQLVIIIAHQQGLKPGEEPAIETIRDSSFIGQESDVVLIVQRKPDATHADNGVMFRGRRQSDPISPQDRTYNLGYSFVKIEKARRAGTYRKRLDFQKSGDWLVAI